MTKKSNRRVSVKKGSRRVKRWSKFVKKMNEEKMSSRKGSRRVTKRTSRRVGKSLKKGMRRVSRFGMPLKEHEEVYRKMLENEKLTYDKIRKELEELRVKCSPSEFNRLDSALKSLVSDASKKQLQDEENQRKERERQRKEREIENERLRQEALTQNANKERKERELKEQKNDAKICLERCLTKLSDEEHKKKLTEIINLLQTQ